MLVGLGHRSRMGKDTLAVMMIEWINLMRPDLRVAKLSWAGKLKDICQQLYGHLGLREAAFYDTTEGAPLRDVKLPAIDKTPVEIWIDMGTPAVRERVWDRTWIEWLVAESSRYDAVIVPDTRFPNEVEVCDWTIKVDNPRVPHRNGRSVDGRLADYDGWDFTVVNDLGLSELRSRVNIVAQRLFGDFKLP